MSSYRYAWPPLGKQAQVIEDHWQDRAHALLCRPGTGKSKMALDHAGRLYHDNKISALLIIAPNGVHKQWVDSALPTHASPDMPYKGGAYSVGMGVRRLDQLRRDLATKDRVLLVLSIGFEALLTPTGSKLARTFIERHAGRSMVVVDESHRVSNTKASGYKAVFQLSRLATYRRIATGTLLRQNPFSAYGQFELLGSGLLGFNNLATFKGMFAEMLPPTNGLVRKIAADFYEKTKKKITPQIQAHGDDGKPIYKNLGFLYRQLLKHSSFLTLEDVSGTEPRIMASTRYVRLTGEQQRLYDDLIQFGIGDLGDGHDITVDGTLALSLRLAQVVGGFCPSDDDPQAKPVGGDNPKLEELMTCLEEIGPEKVIVWAKFKAELRAIVAALAETYGAQHVVEYHGEVNEQGRQDAKERFRSDAACRFFVAQQKAGGTGLDGLQAMCNYMIFYSNDYSYLDREQAIARLARTGGHPTVNVVDLMAEGTVDADIVRCMQSAEDVHVQVLRRSIIRKWC